MTAAEHEASFVPLAGLGDGVTAVVTTRHGGVSAAPYDSMNLAFHVGDDPAAVLENRTRLCRQLGVHGLTVADQEHGSSVRRIDGVSAGAGHASEEDAKLRLPATDALITDAPGVALTILVADCVPVAIFDPLRRALGVAHAGRAGTMLGIVPRTIEQLREHVGTDPADVRVAIGPHIGPRSYEVGPAEVEAFRQQFGDELVHPTRDDRASIDLEGALRLQLRDAGVTDDRITSAGVDTLAATDRFFSDRSARPCGRFGLVAWLH